MKEIGLRGRSRVPGPPTLRLISANYFWSKGGRNRTSTAIWSKIFSISSSFQKFYQEENPPAWTQEAYRPSRSKCSLCCSISWQGVPHPVLDGGYPIQCWTGGIPSSLGWQGTPSSLGWRSTPSSLGLGVPHQVPHPVLDGRVPLPTWTLDGASPISWMGYPLPGPGMGYFPQSAWWGTPHLNLGSGTPFPLPGPGMWYPPSPRNVDRQIPVKTVPSLVLRTRAVKISVKCYWLRCRTCRTGCIVTASIMSLSVALTAAFRLHSFWRPLRQNMTSVERDVRQRDARVMTLRRDLKRIWCVKISVSMTRNTLMKV